MLRSDYCPRVALVHMGVQSSLCARSPLCGCRISPNSKSRGVVFLLFCRVAVLPLDLRSHDRASQSRVCSTGSHYRPVLLVCTPSTTLEALSCQIDRSPPTLRRPPRHSILVAAEFPVAESTPCSHFCQYRLTSFRLPRLSFSFRPSSLTIATFP